MKITEIKELSTKELAERLAATKVELNKMEINHSISPLDNPTKIKATRRDIARMMSELHQRDVNA